MVINFDIAIFIIFLLGNLFVGLKYGRNVKDISDYALGGRNFSTGALVSTMVATYISGGTFSIILSKIYSDGLFYLFASSCVLLSIVVVAVFLVPKMSEFLGETSVASAMGSVYGKEVRSCTAICGILGNVGGIAVQFAVFGNIISYFLGIPSNIAILASGITVTIYSAFGGIRAVTFTDVLQFIIFGFVLPLIGLMIWDDFYSLDISFKDTFNHPKFDYTNIFSTSDDGLWDMIFLVIYFAMPTITSMDFQRISMGKNIHQVRRAMFISAGIIILIKIVISSISFLIFSTNSGLLPNQLVPFIVDNYSYVGLKGLIIIGISSMAMSTADSRINTASVLFANDLCKMVDFKYNELLVSKIFSLFLGFLSIYLALSHNDLLSIIRKSASYYTPIVVAPLIFTILGFRSTKQTVLIAMFSGAVATHIWPLFSRLDPILPAIIVNIIFLFGSHYILRQVGGWQESTARSEKIRAEYLVRKTCLERLFHKIRNFNFLEFCKEYSPKNEFAYTGIGIYFIIYTLTTIYYTQVNLKGDYGNVILILYQIMIITAIVFTMYPALPLTIKKAVVIKVWWQVALFYMMILLGSFFVIVNDFGILQFAIFAINTIITIILVGWELVLSMTVFGIFLSMQAFKYLNNIEHIDFFSIDSTQFMMMYMLVLVSVVIAVFLKPRQKVVMLNKRLLNHSDDDMKQQYSELEELQKIKNKFLKSISYELNTPVTGIYSIGKVLYENYDKMSLKQKKAALTEITNRSKRLIDLVTDVTNLSKLTSSGYRPNIRDVNVSEIIYQSLDEVQNVLKRHNQKQKFFVNVEDNIRAEIDEPFFKRTIINLLTNAINYGQNMPITITLIENTKEIECSVKDMGMGIPQDELYDIFGAFITSSRTKKDASGRGIGLAIAKKVINMHKGKIWAKNNNGINQGAIFSFVIPKKYQK